MLRFTCALSSSVIVTVCWFGVHSVAIHVMVAISTIMLSDHSIIRSFVQVIMIFDHVVPPEITTAPDETL